MRTHGLEQFGSLGGLVATDVFDSRTIQSTPESGARAGYDGAKRRKGSKVHAAVDTLGHLLALRVAPEKRTLRDKALTAIAPPRYGAPVPPAHNCPTAPEWLRTAPGSLYFMTEESSIMMFVDQDGARFTGRLEPEVSTSRLVLVLVPELGGEPRRVEPYGACPFLLLEATLDERSRLDRACFHLRSSEKHRRH